MLFTSEREPDLGGPIEYVITLNHEGPQPVNLRCMGKVLRSQVSGHAGDSTAYQVAATLERYEFVREQLRSQFLETVRLPHMAGEVLQPD